MTFQNPGAFAVLLPLAGVILLLYILKMKRRDLRVPATFLWPERVEEVRANALFQRLRPSWLLFLQLLALLLVVFAIARPQTQQKGLAGEVTVFVIDTSASMSATDIQPSRFDEAKRQALDGIRSSKPSDRIAIIEAGPTPRVIAPLSTDPARQAAALEALQATDAEAQVGEAMRLAAALVGSIDGARIVLLSDGDFEPITNFSRGKAAVVYRCIGESDANLSVSALGVTDTAKGRELYCSIKNHGSRPMGGTLSLFADGKVIDSFQTPNVAPSSQWGRTIIAPRTAVVFEAKLDAFDLMKSDNYAVALADRNSSLRVLLVTKGNLFLERALSLDPRVTLDKATEVPSTETVGSGAGTYDVVVFDGFPEQAVKARGVLEFGVPGPSSPVVAGSIIKKPTFVWQSKNPLLDSVDLQSVFIDRQVSVTAKPNGETVALSSAGPLIVTSQDPSKRQIFAAFEPLESDFPLQIGFPIFIANALDFLAGGAGSNTLAVKAGQAFSLPTTAEAKLIAPSGEGTVIKPVGTVLTIRDIRKIGRYSLQTEGNTRPIYATLHSDRASTIRPEKNIDLGGGVTKASQSPSRFADFWRPLAVLALFVLAGEWWLFARKS